jgi:glutamine cyclotransferase
MTVPTRQVLLACSLLTLLFSLPLLALGAEPRPAPEFPCFVLRRLPHDPAAFTQGLIMHQGAFLESTGLYGQSSLRRVDPETGAVTASMGLPPRYFGEGLALCPGPQGTRLVQLTWKEGVALFYDPETLRPTGSQRLRGEGWGLTCTAPLAPAPGPVPRPGPGPARLLKSDGSDTLRLLDPSTLAEVGTLRVTDANVPVTRLNELEWHNGWILANIWSTDRIALIRGDTGRVAAWLSLSALRRELGPAAEAANGIAVDRSGRRLYVTGKYWDKLFVLEMPELLTRPPQ